MTLLIIAIHEVEDIFVAYAEDTIDRVIDTIQQQALDYKKGSEVKFDIKKSFLISVSLLMNDI